MLVHNCRPADEPRAPRSSRIDFCGGRRPHRIYLYPSTHTGVQVARKINVYQSLTRWTNCNGKQLCGTCIVDVVEGVDSCTRRSIDEASAESVYYSIAKYHRSVRSACDHARPSPALAA